MSTHTIEDSVIVLLVTRARRRRNSRARKWTNSIIARYEWYAIRRVRPDANGAADALTGLSVLRNSYRGDFKFAPSHLRRFYSITRPMHRQCRRCAVKRLRATPICGNIRQYQTNNNVSIILWLDTDRSVICFCRCKHLISHTPEYLYYSAVSVIIATRGSLPDLVESLRKRLNTKPGHKMTHRLQFQAMCYFMTQLQQASSLPVVQGRCERGSNVIAAPSLSASPLTRRFPRVRLTN